MSETLGRSIEPSRSTNVSRRLSQSYVIVKWLSPTGHILHEVGLLTSQNLRYCVCLQEEIFKYETVGLQ